MDLLTVPDLDTQGHSLLERVAVALSSTLDLREVLCSLAEVTSEALRADRVSIFLLVDGRFEPAVSIGRERNDDLWQAFRSLGSLAVSEEHQQVLDDRRAIAIPDPTRSALVPPGWPERFCLSSVAVVPLSSVGGPCGLMAVDYRQRHEFARAELGLLEAIGDYAGVAIANARQYESARRRAVAQEQLARAAAALVTPAPPDVVAARLAAGFTALLDARCVAIARFDGERELLRPLLVSGRDELPPPLAVREIPARLRRRVARAWERGEPTLSVLEDDPWLSAHLGGSRTGSGCYVVVPLFAEGSPAGAAAVGLAPGGRLGEEERVAVTTLAAIGGAALERHDLLAERDRRLRQLDALYRLSHVLSERADADLLVDRLGELLAPEDIVVAGVTFRDRALARHFGGERPNAAERAAWRDGDGWAVHPDGLIAVPMRVGRRLVGSLRVRPGSLDRERLAFLETVAGGAAEIALRGSLRAAVEQATRERALAAERERIAADLHDTVGQVLVGLTLMGRSLSEQLPEDSHSQAQVDRIAELADGAKWQLDQAIRALAFVPAARRGLAGALRGLAKEIQADSGITIEVHVTGRPARLAGPVERALYRVACEALVNAWRHARCSLISIGLTLTATEVRLTVTDDGTGPGGRVTEIRPDVGIKSMKRTMREVGGELRLSPASPHGLVVEATAGRTKR